MERLGYTRLYATVTGSLLVLIGLFGFLASSEFRTPYLTGELLGVIAVNGWTNSFRVALGLLGLVLAAKFSRAYAAIAGGLLLALGLWGLLATNGHLLLGKLPAGRAANILNIALGLLGLAALIAVHSDGITRRFRQRLERRKRHRVANRRRRKLKEAKEKPKASKSKPTVAPTPSASAPVGRSAQRPVRERTPSDKVRKRDEG